MPRGEGHRLLCGWLILCVIMIACVLSAGICKHELLDAVNHTCFHGHAQQRLQTPEQQNCGATMKILKQGKEM